MVDLPPDVEQTLRDLPDSEWSALQARIRPPDTAERFREIAASVVPASQLDSLMNIANPAAFAINGQIDEARRACAVSMRIDPTQRISVSNARAPFRRQQDIDKLAQAFRIAGMPE